jgi:signal transduction histidine kinase
LLKSPATPVRLRTDPAALRHCFLNLFLNVAEHAAPGSCLKIDCSRGWGSVRLRCENIPPAVCTARQASTDCAEHWGLGLRMVRESLSRLGGRLDVSASGEGGRFVATVEFPALTAPENVWRFTRHRRPGATVETPAEVRGATGA